MVTFLLLVFAYLQCFFCILQGKANKIKEDKISVITHHRPKVFVLFPRIAICEDLGSSGKQGPVEANRSYLNHQFSLVRLAVYLRLVCHLDQCSFSTRWRKFPVCWGDCEVRVRTGSEECLEWKGVSEKR